MKSSNTKFVLTFLITILFSLSALAMPFDHGKGKGKDKRKNHHIQPNSRKKAEKFINGHDARNGRWDGRGPKRRR